MRLGEKGGVGEQFDAFFGQEIVDHHRGVHWDVVPVEEPLPLQSKLAVQDATDGAIRCPMGSGKVLHAHPAVFGDGGGDGGD